LSKEATNNKNNKKLSLFFFYKVLRLKMCVFLFFFEVSRRMLWKERFKKERSGRRRTGRPGAV
jgi:hypothetical protein